MKETLAFVGAGAAAVAARLVFQLFINRPAPGVGPWADSPGTVVVVGIVFFAALIALDRSVFITDDTRNAHGTTDSAAVTSRATSQDTATEVARIFGGVTDDASRRHAIAEWLQSVPRLTVLIPFIFYLRFGTIGPLGWGLTVFFDVYCLLWAIGLYFLPRTEYHSPVRLRGDWLDQVGAFWLVSCAFGPLFGWIVTEALPITQLSWQWVYGLRVLLAAAIPIVLALPLLRYARGRSTVIALPLLLIITLLPVSTAVQVGQDLWEGPRVQSVESTGASELYLEHSGRSLGAIP